MAWQPPSAMGSGAGANAGDGGPLGTEYTLQGVMRFLQIEWHNHERARNAWDIERAEMKSKIAKQEGDHRSARKLIDQLDRQVRMLERALRTERGKGKAVQSGAKAGQDEEHKKEQQAKANAQRPELKAAGPLKQHNSFLDLDSEAPEQSDAEKDGIKDKSRGYLGKCVEEVTYLLTPPAHPPPPQTNPQTGLISQSEAPLSLEEVFMQQRQKGQHPGGPGGSHPSSAPNHQPPPVPSAPDAGHPQSSEQAAFMIREAPSHQQLPQRSMLSDMPSQQMQHQSPLGFPSPREEQVEKVTHSFDAFGRPVAARDDEGGDPRHVVSDDGDGWNFDDSGPIGEQQQDPPSHRRPDTDLFPSANSIPAKSPPRTSPAAHRRRSSGSTSMTRRRSEGYESRDVGGTAMKGDAHEFKVRFALRGHTDVVRSVIFTGGGSPSEPEICTAGDDGTIKRWIIPASYGSFGSKSSATDLDIQCYFTHRGHEGMVTSLAACPSSSTFSTGGRASGDGWIFSGGQDASVRVWERGRVDPKATLEGHTDSVWTVCVLPATCATVFGQDSGSYGGQDRVLLASGSSDGTVKIWAVSAPPQLSSPQTGSRRGVGGSRRHSVTSGSNHPSSPQPSVATTTPFHYMLVHTIEREGVPSPTCISPLSLTGETFVVSFTDSSVLVFDTRTGEEMIGMASTETYDGTMNTSINSVVATSVGPDGGSMGLEAGPGGLADDDSGLHGATGSSGGGGVEGVVISGHEDQFIRFFDANSGQCTYSMLAHPSAISSLSLSKDGREAVSAGHDASIRFWSLEKRVCTQELTSHRPMRGEGVCSVVWSQDNRLVVSAGGDGVVKVWAR